MAKRVASNLDSPWKEALERFLPQFIAFFFPEALAALDWSRGYESLDKELNQIVHDAEIGARVADKLFKVWTKDGDETWLLIHIEVQGRREEGFAARMFTYNYRIFDRYKRPVASLALLCDPDPHWKPQWFGHNVFGCKMGLQFPVAKLLDYKGRGAELDKDQNPFAAVALAHLKVLETRRTPADRLTWKVRLVKGLYDRGLTGDHIRQLFRLIDWMMKLPAELEENFRKEIYRFEEASKMQYVTSIERLALKKGHKEGLEKGLQKGLRKGLRKGHREGLLEGIAVALEAKFGDLDKSLFEDIKALKKIADLRNVASALKTGKTLGEIRRILGR
jgi:hypothetical protein